MSHDETSSPEEDLRVADFDYDLPGELIAQRPIDRRDASRLLVLDRGTGAVTHATFADIGSFLRRGDLLVANNSRVIPARLHGRRASTDGQVELLLLRNLGNGTWQALGRPARRMRAGETLVLEAADGATTEQLEVVGNDGDGLIRLRLPGSVERQLDRFGEIPLPPYIHDRLEDRERYQTTYARVTGSAAAPTAGLHFTDELRQALRDQGVGWAEVTLHVGLDTFRPMQGDHVREHRIHTEWCTVDDETAHRIAETRRRGGRVVAVGTTSARVLESLGASWDDDRPQGMTGDTSIFIVPGHRWTLVDGLITNFHLPKSTLMLLVSALAGRENILSAYTAAIEERYRFFSFGDAMLIIDQPPADASR